MGCIFEKVESAVNSILAESEYLIDVDPIDIGHDEKDKLRTALANIMNVVAR